MNSTSGGASTIEHELTHPVSRADMWKASQISRVVPRCVILPELKFLPTIGLLKQWTSNKSAPSPRSCCPRRSFVFLRKCVPGNPECSLRTCKTNWPNSLPYWGFLQRRERPSKRLASKNHSFSKNVESGAKAKRASKFCWKWIVNGSSNLHRKRTTSPRDDLSCTISKRIYELSECTPTSGLCDKGTVEPRCNEIVSGQWFSSSYPIFFVTVELQIRLK